MKIKKPIAWRAIGVEGLADERVSWHGAFHFLEAGRSVFIVFDEVYGYHHRSVGNGLKAPSVATIVKTVFFCEMDDLFLPAFKPFFTPPEEQATKYQEEEARGDEIHDALTFYSISTRNTMSSTVYYSTMLILYIIKTVG